MKRSLSASSSTASYVTAEDERPQQRSNPKERVASLNRGISPPPAKRQHASQRPSRAPKAIVSVLESSKQPTTAQVEAGLSEIDDHVGFFSTKLAAFARPGNSSPRLSYNDWLDLYRRNETGEGHHFVIHQHDHPIAGTHYDLRLQINATSSISFAVMYGLPGDPNSRRLNRNATETRVHCFWVGTRYTCLPTKANQGQNHLIETASPQTGTMLIWDTGEYEVLDKKKVMLDGSDTDPDPDSQSTHLSSIDSMTYSQPDKLAMAFSHRKIRLRLHGTRLPPGYTLYLRLTKDNDRYSQPKAPAFRRRRKVTEQPPPKQPRRSSTTSTSSSSSRPPSTSEPDTDISTATRSATHRRFRRTISSLKRTASPPRLSKTSASSLPTIDPSTPSIHSVPTTAQTPSEDPSALAPDDAQPRNLTASDDDSDETIRRTNAYPGATNSVGSVHQRRWYLSLDRELSGFKAIPTPRNINHHAKTYWVPCSSDDDKPRKTVATAAQGAPGFERFHILGREHERSVVTGRLAAEILADEGVEGYVPRGLWRPVLE
jgi:hypothetical protein